MKKAEAWEKILTAVVAYQDGLLKQEEAFNQVNTAVLQYNVGGGLTVKMSETEQGKKLAEFKKRLP